MTNTGRSSRGGRALAGAVVTVASVLIGAGPALAAADGTGAGTASDPSGSAAATTPAAPAPPACDPDASWPGYVQGAPDLKGAHPDGAYLWHYSQGGFGLRVSHPRLPGRADRVVFSGAVTTAGKIVDVKTVKTEKSDQVKVSADGHTLRFRFTNYGGIDGVDFHTTCTPGLRVDLRADGGKMPPRFIHLGHGQTHPAGDPFMIRRVDDGSGNPSPVTGNAGTAG